MITVTSVTEMGGACPWQLSGLTDTGHEVYARYRGGRCAVYLAQDPASPVRCGDTQDKVFECYPFGGPSLDGSLNGATLAHLTAGVITWPDSVTNDGTIITP